MVDNDAPTDGAERQWICAVCATAIYDKHRRTTCSRECRTELNRRRAREYVRTHVEQRAHYYLEHREERIERNRQWQRANREKAREHVRRWAAKHAEYLGAPGCGGPVSPDEALEIRRIQQATQAAKAEARAARGREEARRRYAADPVAAKVKGRCWRLANPEKTRAWKRRWMQEHPAAAAEMGRRYRQAHPEKVREAKRRRRQRQKEEAEFLALQAFVAHGESGAGGVANKPAPAPNAQTYYWRNREKIRSYQKRYRELNREKIRALDKRKSDFIRSQKAAEKALHPQPRSQDNLSAQARAEQKRRQRFRDDPAYREQCRADWRARYHANKPRYKVWKQRAAENKRQAREFVALQALIAKGMSHGVSGANTQVV